MSSQSYYIALGRAVSNAITQLQSSLNEQPISIDCKWSNDREVVDDLRVDRAIVGRSLGKHWKFRNCWVNSTSSQGLLNVQSIISQPLA